MDRFSSEPAWAKKISRDEEPDVRPDDHELRFDPALREGPLPGGPGDNPETPTSEEVAKEYQKNVASQLSEMIDRDVEMVDSEELRRLYDRVDGLEEARNKLWDALKPFAMNPAAAGIEEGAPKDELYQLTCLASDVAFAATLWRAVKEDVEADETARKEAARKEEEDAIRRHSQEWQEKQARGGDADG